MKEAENNLLRIQRNGTVSYTHLDVYKRQRDCQIIKRREVCYQAAEHVVSIPLTEEQTSTLLMVQLMKYFSYLVLFLVGLFSLMLYRLLKVLVGRMT